MFADREDELLLTVTMEDKLDKTGKCPVMPPALNVSFAQWMISYKMDKQKNRWSSAHSQTVELSITEIMTMINPQRQTCNIVLAFLFCFVF